ncbi:MAG: hypothetical protein D6790_18400 [Caldilineae bacterium]|nr:MAG: hypothetical protein D6790_18400 [Caldilineae bacterium]
MQANTPGKAERARDAVLLRHLDDLASRFGSRGLMIPDGYRFVVHEKSFIGMSPDTPGFHALAASDPSAGVALHLIKAHDDLWALFWNAPVLRTGIGVSARGPWETVAEDMRHVPAKIILRRRSDGARANHKARGMLNTAAGQLGCFLTFGLHYTRVYELEERSVLRNDEHAWIVAYGSRARPLEIRYSGTWDARRPCVRSLVFSKTPSKGLLGVRTAFGPGTKLRGPAWNIAREYSTYHPSSKKTTVRTLAVADRLDTHAVAFLEEPWRGGPLYPWSKIPRLEVVGASPEAGGQSAGAGRDDSTAWEVAAVLAVACFLGFRGFRLWQKAVRARHGR